MDNEFQKRIKFVSEFNYKTSDDVIEDLFKESELIGIIPVKELQKDGIHFVKDLLLPAIIVTFVNALNEVEKFQGILFSIVIIYGIWILYKWIKWLSRTSKELPLALAITKDKIIFVSIMEKIEKNGKYYNLNSVEESTYNYPKINEVLQLKRKGKHIYKEFDLALSSGSLMRFEILSSKFETSTKYFQKNVISSTGLLKLSNNFEQTAENNT